MWIVCLALRRPYTIAVACFLIFLMGFLSLREMAVDIFPVIDIPVVGVIWSYPGLSTEDVERRVVLPSERSLSTTVGGISRIESESLPGIGFLRIYFLQGTNIGSSIAQISAVSSTILRILPPGMQPPTIVQFNASSVPVVQMTMSSPVLREEQIFDYALNFITLKLFTIPGLSCPAPYGGKIRQVNIDVDPVRAQARGLSPQDIVAALTNSNLILPAGTARIGAFEYSIRINSSPTSVNEFNKIPIKLVNGRPVLMADVARISDGYADQANIVRVNGERAVYLDILKKADASTLEVVEQAKKILPEIRAVAPKDLNIRLDFDQSTFVRAAISSVLSEAFVSSVLVSIMILFFLGSWRSVIVVCTSIPLAVFCAIIGLKLTGNTINIMTLGGLSLAIGMLVDDATVEVENIHRNRLLGNPLTVAILLGAQQIALPAIMATLAICIVFFPVVLLTGPARFLFTPMALAVVFSMLSSYVLSRTLVPLLSRMLLAAEKHGGHPEHAAPPGPSPVAPPKVAEAAAKIETQKNPFKKYFARIPQKIAIVGALQNAPWGKYWDSFNVFRENAFARLQNRYEDLLRVCLEHRKFCLKIFFGVLAITAFLPFALGRDFFPNTDVGLMKLHYRAPSGTRIEVTERQVARVEKIISDIVPKDELRTINSMIGVPTPENLAYVATENVTGLDAEILVQLHEDHHPTAIYMKKLRQALGNEFPGSSYSFQTADIVSQVLNFGLSSPIDVQVESNNIDEAYHIARVLRDEIRGIPGAVDVNIRQLFDYPTLKLNVDRVLAAHVGLTQRDVSNSLLVSLAASSLLFPSFFLNPENDVNYNVVAKVPLLRLSSVGELLSLPVTAPNVLSARQSIDQDRGVAPYSPAVTLGSIARLDSSSTMDEINHNNVQRIVDITANVEDSDLGSVISGISKVIKKLGKLPNGMKLVVRGQGEVMKEAFTKLGTGLVLAMILVYLLMVVLFQSWLDPFIVMVAVPGALTGILWMLFVTGTTINVESFMGSIMAVGIAASNSILMVSFANEMRVEKGVDSFEAALMAGQTRLRPVLMTALAMILGMLPAALGLGEGGEQNAPLGRAVIGGLLVATCVTLFIVPLIYATMRKAMPTLHQLDAKFKAESAGKEFDAAAVPVAH